VGGGDRLHDGQPEADSLAVAGAVDGGSLEGLQEPLDFAGRHRWSGVGDDEHSMPRSGVSDHLDVAAPDVVTDRVVDQVADESFE
jgi:hypothetical protein